MIFSYQHVVELFLILGLLSITRAYLYSLVVTGCKQIHTFEEKEGWSIRKKRHQEHMASYKLACSKNGVF